MPWGISNALRVGDAGHQLASCTSIGLEVLQPRVPANAVNPQHLPGHGNGCQEPSPNKHTARKKQRVEFDVIEGQAVAGYNVEYNWWAGTVKEDWPMGNRKRQPATLECFGVQVPGVWKYHLPAGTLRRPAQLGPHRRLFYSSGP